MCNIDIPPLPPQREQPDIKMAGKNVGLDIEKPIDISQMRIAFVSYTPRQKKDGRRYFECITELFADIETETGFEPIKITIVRESQKKPNLHGKTMD